MTKLKWSDFKGKIRDNGQNLAAVTAYILEPITIRKDDLLSYSIRVLFKRYLSWTKDTISLATLSHEQLHFDIAELYARKLRRAIQAVPENIQNPKESDFDPIFENLFAENAKVQRQYDEATIHGLDKESQKEWARKICLELEKLNDFASTSPDCK